jgi:hypothetical protein
MGGFLPQMPQALTGLGSKLEKTSFLKSRSTGAASPLRTLLSAKQHKCSKSGRQPCCKAWNMAAYAESPLNAGDEATVPEMPEGFDADAVNKNFVEDQWRRGELRRSM